jgi:hypothetical protein
MFRNHALLLGRTGCHLRLLRDGRQLAARSVYQLCHTLKLGCGAFAAANVDPQMPPTRALPDGVCDDELYPNTLQVLRTKDDLQDGHTGRGGASTPSLHCMKRQPSFVSQVECRFGNPAGSHRGSSRE